MKESKPISSESGFTLSAEAQNAFELIENTKQSIFLTGKAGTGKSTFIQHLVTNSKKQFLLTAFTGIAALNIRGATIHSVFNLPVKPLMPRDHEIKPLRNSHPKRKIIDKADVLVIDEVSMLRADLLEAVDYSLRLYGDFHEPFGGKQILFVGDPFQLPPVVSRDPLEKSLFENIYDGPYFFQAPAYKALKPVPVCFTTVYRQKEERFMHLLNNIRRAELNDDDWEILQDRNVKPNNSNEDFVIRLCSTNAAANSVNDAALRSLNAKSKIYKARIEGTFKPDRFPTETALLLKEGAQVMVIKNDTTQNPENRRWYNGSLGVVLQLQEDHVKVRLSDGSIYEIGEETWEQTEYTFDKGNNRIDSEVIGSFKQIPLKTAWAITIHKSQGLTFEHVEIDLGKGAFAPGQTYTALSRCRTLSGLYLSRPLRPEDLFVDDRLVRFAENLNLF